MTTRIPIYLLLSTLLIIVSALIESLLDGVFLHVLGGDTNFDTIMPLFFITMIIHVIYWLSSLLMRLVLDWFVNTRVQQQVKAQHTETELALLKSQVHPHFLFNSLNTLYSSSYEYGDEETANGIGKLSHLLRYMLYETKGEKVQLESEVDYLQDYIDLQKMRFVDDVTVTFNIHGDTAPLTVAPMMFITLVENAFKHGISPAKHSTIEIDLTISTDDVTLTVQNDILRERAKSELEGRAGGLGLENLQRRLTLLYPERHQLTMAEQNNHYIAKLELKWA
jgi:two-component system LytT family sensor kinase